MNPIDNVLDEKFFEDASDVCLGALAKLIDDAIAVRLKRYVELNPDSVVTKRIQEHLGEAIKLSTFHFELLEKDYVRDIKKLILPNVIEPDTDTDALLEELLFLQENMPYIVSYCKTRTEDDFMKFVESAPPEYQRTILSNRPMFYHNKEHERRTGVGAIRNKRDVIDIAVKGIQYRKYMSSIGISTRSYKIKEF